MRPLGVVTGRLYGMAHEFLVLLPQMVIALLVVALTWLVARIGSNVVQRVCRRSRMRAELAELIGNLSSILLWLGGVLIAAVIAFPNLSPSSLLAGIGVGSVAIGFAFKDIFENFLAGLLILYRDPMRIGDFIECEGIEGRVERITIRDTLVRRTDDQLIVLPNSMLFKNPVQIRTDLPQRRVTIICGVAYGEDVGQARGVIEEALRGLDTVAQDKPIQVFAHDFGESSIDFEIAWWTGSTPLDERRSRDKVVAAIKRALDEAGIEIPFPYRTLTFKEPLPLMRATETGGGEQQRA